MAKKKRERGSDPEQRAFDERTRMIEDYIAQLRQRVEARRNAASEPGSS
jgi:hypothetical protein